MCAVLCMYGIRRVGVGEVGCSEACSDAFRGRVWGFGTDGLGWGLVSALSNTIRILI